jgi:hypothetical protein
LRPSPRHALPCMQASVSGEQAANRSSMARTFFVCEKSPRSASLGPEYQTWPGQPPGRCAAEKVAAKKVPVRSSKRNPHSHAWGQMRRLEPAHLMGAE